MGDPERESALFPRQRTQDATVQINDRCVIRTQDGHRVVVVSGVALAQYTLADRMAEAHAMVSLVEQGWADQNDVARAFGCSVRTVRRYQRRFESGGLSALGRPSGYPKGRRRQGQERLKSVLRWKSEGLSNREVAHRLGVSEKTVRKLLRQAGWVPAEPVQTHLPCRRVRTQTCPLFLHPPSSSLRSRCRCHWIPILPTGVWTGCWPIWDCWRMQHRCFDQACACLAPGSFWLFPL